MRRVVVPVVLGIFLGSFAGAQTWTSIGEHPVREDEARQAGRDLLYWQLEARVDLVWAASAITSEGRKIVNMDPAFDFRETVSSELELEGVDFRPRPRSLGQDAFHFDVSYTASPARYRARQDLLLGTIAQLESSLASSNDMDQQSELLLTLQASIHASQNLAVAAVLQGQDPGKYADILALNRVDAALARLENRADQALRLGTLVQGFIARSILNPATTIHVEMPAMADGSPIHPDYAKIIRNACGAGVVANKLKVLGKPSQAQIWLRTLLHTDGTSYVCTVSLHGGNSSKAGRLLARSVFRIEGPLAATALASTTSTGEKNP